MLLPPIIIMTHDYSYALNTRMLVGYIMSRVCLRWDLFFGLPFCSIWGCMCWTGPFEFRWLKGYIYNPCYHHQIGRIHRPHCCHIFRGCVSGMAVLSYSVIYYIYIPGALGHCFHRWCSVYGICKWSDTLWPVGRVRLFANFTFHYHHYADLPEGIELKCLSGIYCRACWRQFSQLSFIQFMGLCVSSLPNSPVMIMRMCILS